MDPLQNQPAPGQQAEKKAFGPLIGIAIVIVALVVGGLYFWGQKVADESSGALEEGRASAPSQELTQGDDVSSIEQDLSADPSVDLDFSDLEAELAQ